MQPKVSIIIPVYNVEPYLRQCLDSVVHQTLRDIQILCVNDGSTDGSLSILQEYARRDSRVTVIDQPNGGCPGRARNAAIPHVQGEYVYFLDSDDWIDPSLCEKAYYRLESTGANVVFFFHHEAAEAGEKGRLLSALNHCRWSLTPSSTSDFIGFSPAPWNRVIRTSFFEGLGTQFPENSMEDLFMHWILLANEPHVELILEKLYYYRLRGESLMGQRGGYLTRRGPTYALIKNHLRRTGRYEPYRDMLLKRKFYGFLNTYTSIHKNHRPDMVRRFRESLDEDEIDFLQNSEKIQSHNRDSILYLLGDKSYYWKYVWHTFVSRCLKKLTKPIENALRFFRQNKKIDERESRICELSEQIAERDRLIVQLRSPHESSEELQTVNIRQSLRFDNKKAA